MTARRKTVDDFGVTVEAMLTLARGVDIDLRRIYQAQVESCRVRTRDKERAETGRALVKFLENQLAAEKDSPPAP